MDVLVVGAGAMGRWFAAVVEGAIAFADVDPERARTAADATAGRTVNVDTDERFDLVCLAVPMTATVEAIKRHVGQASDAVVDLSGAMAAPVEAMAEVAVDLERLSLHPLFSPENAPGRIAVVASAPGPITDAVLGDLEAAGNELFETTPAEHDEAMRTVQARAHAAVIAFALAAEPVPDDFGTPVYDGLVELVDEVLGGNARVYADIQSTFDGADDVAGAARRIAEADADAFERLYHDAGR